MTKDEALKLLELIEKHNGERTFFDGELVGAFFTVGHLEQLVEEAIALAQPVKEPVAWISVNDKLPPQEINFLSFSEIFGYQVSMYSKNQFNSTGLPTLEKLKITKWMPIPLYTHPAPEQNKSVKQWQGLSDDEINELSEQVYKNGGWDIEFARAIEQELKTNNGFSNVT